ncbi:MAG: AAA family ATPase [Defluviitaleaceae bacterium]|nr:AAA family ATPase [Defluviitaleaceae bacterium]
MRVETLKIKNFKVFKDISILNIPNMAVFLGMHGVGKSTFFDIFGFLNDCLAKNVKAALAARGGFNEVISREQSGAIEFFIQFRQAENEPLVTYELSIELDLNKQPVVAKEIVRYRRGQSGAPTKILDFAKGEGVAFVGELKTRDDINNADRREQKLDSPDILAIKGLGQFKEFDVIAASRKLIEDWYVSDFHIEDARQRNEAGYSENLSKKGDNLANVAQYIYDNHPDIFSNILLKMKERVPGISNIEASVSDGYIMLKFADGKFKNPFSARFVSDGTIKMFAYLIMLNDPSPHTLLCVEEPENQLYPKLLAVLAEEFRSYSGKGGQVFISTHSPDLLNAVELSELFCLVKEDGFTNIFKASDSPLITNLYNAGDALGYLWTQDLLFEEAFTK